MSKFIDGLSIFEHAKQKFFQNFARSASNFEQLALSSFKFTQAEQNIIDFPTPVLSKDHLSEKNLHFLLDILILIDPEIYFWLKKNKTTLSETALKSSCNRTFAASRTHLRQI